MGQARAMFCSLWGKAQGQGLATSGERQGRGGEGRGGEERRLSGLKALMARFDASESFPGQGRAWL